MIQKLLATASVLDLMVLNSDYLIPPPLSQKQLVSIEIHAYRDMSLFHASALKEDMLAIHMLKPASMKKIKGHEQRVLRYISIRLVKIKN